MIESLIMIICTVFALVFAVMLACLAVTAVEVLRSCDDLIETVCYAAAFLLAGALLLAAIAIILYHTFFAP